MAYWIAVPPKTREGGGVYTFLRNNPMHSRKILSNGGELRRMLIA